MFPTLTPQEFSHVRSAVCKLAEVWMNAPIVNVGFMDSESERRRETRKKALRTQLDAMNLRNIIDGVELVDVQ